MTTTPTNNVREGLSEAQASLEADAATRKSAATILDLHISGLKCDAPRCGWRDDSVTLEEYPEYLNARCPVCGSNVLTEADLRTVNRIVRNTTRINQWFGWLAVVFRRKSRAETIYTADFNGTGRIGPIRRMAVGSARSTAESTGAPEAPGISPTGDA